MTEAPSDSRFLAFLAEVLQRIDRGEEVDPVMLEGEHPEFAEEIRSYFEAAALFAGAADNPDATTVRGSSSGKRVSAETFVSGAPNRIRYFGDYELIDEIARGGMGVVYRANQVSLRREVALKMILGGGLASRLEIERFHREAEAAGNLDHPNIVPIFEIGEHAGHHYFTMKLVNGTNASQQVPVLRAEPRLAAQVLAKVAHAVHYAHQRSILHRDLKPSNILIDINGEPFVTDFGLARRITDTSGLTHAGDVVGTPSYMSPEQAAGETSITTAADVYSLGAILYEFLCGRPPFQAETFRETLRQVLDVEPVLPRSLDHNIDRDLETIALRCLEKSPARRYQSAEAVADELERWLRYEPIEARPATQAERLSKWARRRPAIAVLSLIIALSVVAGVGGITMQWRRAEHALHGLEASLSSERLHSAREALGVGNVSTGFRLMAAIPRYLRGWEWQLLTSHTPLIGSIATQHAIKSIGMTDDGRWIALAEGDHIAVHDRSTGARIARFLAPESPITHLSFSPDGQSLAVASSTRVEVIPLHGGARRIIAAYGPQNFNGRSMFMPGEVRALVWIDRGAGLLIAFGRSLELRDASTGDVRRAMSMPVTITDATLSGDGRSIAIATEDEQLSLRRLPELTEEWRMPHAGSRPVFSADGMEIAAFGLQPPVVRIFDTRSGSLKETVGHPPGQPLDARWTADAITVATARETYRIDAKSRTTRSLLRTEYSPASILTRDGQFLAAANNFTRALETWSLHEKETATTVLRLSAGVRAWTASDDGTLLAFIDGKGALSVCRMAGRDLVPIRRFEPVSPGGGKVATTSGAIPSPGPGATSAQIAAFNEQPGELSRRARLLSSELIRRGETRFLRFSPNHDRVLEARDGVITVWDLGTRRVIRLKGRFGHITAARFSESGRLIATTDQNPFRDERVVTGSPVRIWSAIDGLLVNKWLDTASGSEQFVLQFSASDALLLAGHTSHRLIRPVSGGIDIARLSDGYHPNLVASHDGRHVAWSPLSPLVYLEDFGPLSRLGMNAPRLAHFFRRWTSPRVRELLGHVAQVDRVAYSPDGAHLATVSRDGLMKVWDANSGREVITLDRNDGLSTAFRVETPDDGDAAQRTRENVRLSFSSDGRRLTLITRCMAPNHYEQSEIRAWEIERSPRVPIGEVPSDVTYRRCASESSLRSVNSDEPVVLTFVNHGETLVARYWIDYAGQRNFYGFIAPHHKAVSFTFTGHPWVIADPYDNCIATTIAGPRNADAHF